MSEMFRTVFPQFHLGFRGLVYWYKLDDGSEIRAKYGNLINHRQEMQNQITTHLTGKRTKQSLNMNVALLIKISSIKMPTKRKSRVCRTRFLNVQ